MAKTSAEKTTAELTNNYIKEHIDIKSCLKKGIINYSSLARLIAKELNIEKKTSKEAILIAARRFQEKLKKEINHEKKIKNLLGKSEIEIKNKIEILILEKNIAFSDLEKIQQKIKKDFGTFYLLEGSSNYTIITQEKFADLILKNYSHKLIMRHQNLAIINFKSPEDIEYTPGIIHYLSSFFFENGVNIIELISFWTDTIFAVKKEDVNKTLEFLRF